MLQLWSTGSHHMQFFSSRSMDAQIHSEQGWLPWGCLGIQDTGLPFGLGAWQLTDWLSGLIMSLDTYPQERKILRSPVPVWLILSPGLLVFNMLHMEFALGYLYSTKTYDRSKPFILLQFIGEKPQQNTYTFAKLLSAARFTGDAGFCSFF